jgi:hypothetical protein
VKLLTTLYRVWWPFLDVGRLLIRFGVERWRSSWLWPLGMTLRLALHHLVASPWLVLLAALIVWRHDRLSLLLGALVVVLVELVLRVGERFWRPATWVMCLRKGLGVRRRFPRLWADYAGRTKRVQAETGKEPSTPVRWRPLVDHPRISWWLSVDTAQRSVTFVVGPPPDRTFAEFAVALPAVAARLPWVDSLDLEFESERSSFGRLRVFFDDVLAVAQEATFDGLAEVVEVAEWH